MYRQLSPKVAAKLTEFGPQWRIPAKLGECDIKGFCTGSVETSQGGPPLAILLSLTCIPSNFARFRSYPKSFRIWSFQTDVTSGFQGFCLKASHLGEIVVQSWKLGAEFDI